ncbi:MAG: (2Fe-2S)-binding protein, partial [Desulfohalobiaceae bacterium]|nr:(2Fe-2S)-binding protein [Desulfohalobiaceae bacterium]
MEEITISLNGQTVTCDSGSTILQVAEKQGITIPTLCHHPELKPYGACRICLVEEEKSGRLLAACVAPVMQDMQISTHSERVLEHRRNLLRLMIAEHPESCIVCSKGNRCRLRGLAATFGLAETGLHPMSNFRPLEEANPFIIRDLSKCIHCAKCIRADHELVVVGA